MTSTTRTDVDSLKRIRDRLSQTRLIDRSRLQRELDRLFSRRERDKDFERSIAHLESQVEASAQRVATLKGAALRIEYDPNLPITAHREEVLKALTSRQVIILCGATGSGKTTQLPKFCLEAGRGLFGMIGHTQPRRIAARAIAARVADELDSSIGKAVGFQVRFNDKSGPECRIKLMTDGILLKELESDRLLHRYDTLIIDEAHERSLNIDLLLGALKRILPKRPDLKLIVTSATIDPEKFSKFFDNAPIIEVSGRSYPVEVLYRPLMGEDEDATELSLPEGVVEAVKELGKNAREDVLVFLPGEKQIRECTEALSRAKLSSTEILPLFSRLSTKDQEKIFERHTGRRVVLATNVAETSLTVPGIRHVVDSGLARISRYSVRGKVQRLPIEKISKASADQRKGRCGREAEGICVRLYPEDDFIAREEFTPPEVLRTNLASVILRLAVLEFGEPQDFPFVDPPDTRLINDGYRLLNELKAVTEDRRVTALGRQIASLPVDPRLARMLIAASNHRCLVEMLIIASFLEIQDPRERPADAQTQADQAHALFADARSDFSTVLKLWKSYREQSDALSGSQLRKWCREHFLSFVRMREWQELHRQLSEAVDEIELKRNQTEADYSDLHQAILTGFLGNIGALDERREYIGARGARFIIAPGTPLASKPPKWITAGSIVETTRVFARMVAGVEPHWIEQAGEHLLKRSHSEPQWLEEKGFVTAHESVSLYGLVLAGQRRINYGSVAPKEARDMLVREALVEGRTRFRAGFLDHNRKLRAGVETLEAKIRRRDILADDEKLCEFYRNRLPETIHSIAALEKWLRAGTNHADRLRMSRDDVLRRDPSEIALNDYPDSIEIAGNGLSLSYSFEPGQSNDGVTVTVPEPLLSTLSASQLAWIVPGWHLEKITSILRALPKEIRKHFVPVPDAAARCLSDLHGAVSSESVAKWIARESGQPMSVDQLQQLPLPDYLKTNLRVVRLDGVFVAEGRDLASTRRSARSAAPATSATPSTELHREWDFGDLPKSKLVARKGVTFTVHPAIKDATDGVYIEECGTPEEADRLSSRGVIRLAMLQLPQQVKLAQKAFTDRRDLVLLIQSFGPQRALADGFSFRVFAECFFSAEQSLPRSRNDFIALLDGKRQRIGEVIERVSTVAFDVLTAARTIRQQMSGLKAPQFADALEEIDAQMRALLPVDFLSTTPTLWFSHLPRYLRALNRRLERIVANQKRDADLSKTLAPFAKAAADLSGRAANQPELEKLKWMIEEMRVSLFAQELKTAIPVSEKRMSEQLEKARKEAAT